MPRKVTKIPEAQRIPVKEHQLRVATYCRVSTKHEEQQQSLEAQIDYYTNYVENHPNWVLVAVYFDTASGIRTNQRPRYQQLLKDCTSKKKQKSRSDSVEVPQSFWPGRIGNHPSNQEVEENEHWSLY